MNIFAKEVLPAIVLIILHQCMFGLEYVKPTALMSNVPEIGDLEATMDGRRTP